MPTNRDSAAAAVVSAAAALALAAVAAAGCSQQSSSGSDATPAPPPPYGAAAPSPSATPALSGAQPNFSGAPVVAAPTAPPGSPAGVNEPAAAAGGAPPAAPPLPAGGPVGAAPFMGMGDPTAPLSPTPDLDKAIAEAEKSKDKKAIGAAYAARGIFRMNDDKAGQRVKYRAALDDYRKALAADPTNADAKKNKDLIESIYKSMGRPIPGEDGK